MNSALFTLRNVHKRRNVGTVEYAQIDDFETSVTTTVKVLREIKDWPGYLMYCADFERRRAIFSRSGQSVWSALDTTFLYEWQRSKAIEILDVPFERLSELGDATGMSPMFIMTIGRSGSTLLVNILRRLGERVAAEPDSFTSLASAYAASELWTADHELVLKACVENVRLLWGESPYIKLRGVCSNLSAKIAAALQRPRFLFIFRERRAWAQSHARAFGIAPMTMVGVLRGSLMAYDQLVSRGVKPSLIWYEDLCAEPLKALGDIEGLNVPMGARALLGNVLEEDAQSNTPLSRANISHVTISKEEMAMFDEAWKLHMPIELLERHGLSRLG